MTQLSTVSSATEHGDQIRLIDIAQKTGYSLATVSKVLNNRSGVSQKAAEVIRKQLQQAGYKKRMSNEARRERTIEIVFQSFDSIWSLEVLQGALDYASAHNVSITVTESGDRQHPDSSWISGLAERKPIGVVLIFSDLTQTEKDTLKLLNIPYVIFDPSGDPATDSRSISADNWTGGVLATRYLLSIGHRKIGVITGPHEMMCSTARLDGFTAEMRAHGFPIDSSWIGEADFSMIGGYHQAVRLLRNASHRPTAIFACDDLQAMGVYEAARRLRLRIPDDLSVVGFDNIQTSAFMNPPLTTIEQPIRKMAGTAVRLLFTSARDDRSGRNTHNARTAQSAHSAHGDSTPDKIVMPTSLVVRQSTRPWSDGAQ